MLRRAIIAVCGRGVLRIQGGLTTMPSDWNHRSTSSISSGSPPEKTPIVFPRRRRSASEVSRQSCSRFIAACNCAKQLAAGCITLNSYGYSFAFRVDRQARKQYGYDAVQRDIQGRHARSCCDTQGSKPDPAPPARASDGRQAITREHNRDPARKN